MKSVGLILAALGCASLAVAQTPSVNSGGVVNVASYAFAGLPNGDIAQGSMVTIFGSNLGPATLVQATSFPLPTSLGGTSIKVTSGSASAQAILFFVSAGQIAAVIPSSLPTGNASLTVTTGGGTSAAASFKIVANSFGAFAANGGGSGPGIIVDAKTGQVFGPSTAANADDMADIWGTGLGPVSGDESASALPGDMPSVPVEVYVNNVKANVVYRGRSGCCVGVDQVRFTVPANVTGCQVSVALKINNVVSNFTTMPIAPKGTRTCSDAGAPSTSDLEKFSKNGAAIGVVGLTRTSISIDGLPSFPGLPSIPTTQNADVGFAHFSRYTPLQFNSSTNPFNTTTIGSCTVSQFRGSSAPSTSSDPINPKSLDAGAQISVMSSSGTTTQLTKQMAGGIITYLSPTTALTTFLEPGAYKISGSGGADVGAFQANLTVPALLNWTNKDSISSVVRANGQAITWTGGDPNGIVFIGGFSAGGTAANSPSASFQCTAKTTDGQFTIPSVVLLSLPASANVSGVSLGGLFVGASSAPALFTATGLDYGIAVSAVDAFKTLGIN